MIVHFSLVRVIKFKVSKMKINHHCHPHADGKLTKNVIVHKPFIGLCGETMILVLKSVKLAPYSSSRITQVSRSP